MRRLARNLTFQVLVAVALGVLLGALFPAVGKAMKPVGDTFINLVKMIIAPIIFLTIVLGIANMHDIRKVGRVGGKAFLYFEVVTTLALAVGLLVVNLTKPGAGIDVSVLAKGDVSQYTTAGQHLSFVDFVTHIVPTSIVGAFAQGDILQIVFFSLLFGVALSRLGEHGRGLTVGLEKLSEVFFRITSMVMRVAPLGAFGAMAYTIGNFGLRALLPLAHLMGGVYLTMALFIFVVLNAIARFNGFSLWRLLKYIRAEILIVLGTSSSEAALPSMLARMENYGCDRTVVGLVIPAGYSFNLDGTSIYLSMATIFIAQAFGIHLPLGQQLAVLAVLMVTSKGAAGVTGSGFIVLASTLSAMHTVPVEGIALVLGVDRFMSEARAITNLIGNAVATVVIAKSERAFDAEKNAIALAAPTGSIELVPELPRSSAA
ncbi:MAG: dicarboxylate/amino acid:cation symporter [Gemmatimonadaceae bacterium]|nr:dicarboxylate/amino acid:cation symporter [Gemmatimonadaceae bacterium]NUR19668.1 dicarboxylate/amino acid:cation symporter [Gemmatimonadaceae bacterium]NUS98996.1 dicarboxylate/amino acid:cation symporter [Gemmatimonadaceae bacterium]